MGLSGVDHPVDGKVKWIALRQSGTRLQMEISDRLRCLYSARVEERDGEYVVDVPAQEVELGDIEAGETYRIALLPTQSVSETGTEESPTPTTRDQRPPEPPVDEGEQRDVEIEDIGEQGDGITRVERGFVVIVPDTSQGERVTVEITDVRENLAFAEVVSRETHFE
jgi:predicted RNA-binding protein with TRAM domain